MSPSVYQQLRRANQCHGRHANRRSHRQSPNAEQELSLLKDTESLSRKRFERAAITLNKTVCPIEQLGVRNECRMRDHEAPLLFVYVERKRSSRLDAERFQRFFWNNDRYRRSYSYCFLECCHNCGGYYYNAIIIYSFVASSQFSTTFSTHRRFPFTC